MLIVLQGPPGSGKSHAVAEFMSVVRSGVKIVSTDDFHYDEEGTYRFDPLRIREFHQWNEWLAEHYLKQGYSVIVDNTNIARWQAAPYVKAAVALGVEVQFVRCEGRYPNSHGVSDEVVERMRAAMEELTVEGCLAQ